jgi:phospholipid/cholesterol/gamma-HCH transport system ATP-binding protein
MLIVTHDVNTARTVPDNIGLLYRRHLAMFGPREMLLSSQEPVVRQFLNARRQGPIGMAEEKDAAELAAEKEEGEELPPLPPIPPQISPSSGEERKTQRPAGQWLKENNVEPPPGSFSGDEGYGAASAPTATTEDSGRRSAGSDGERQGGSVRLLEKNKDDDAPAPRKTTTRKTAAKKTSTTTAKKTTKKTAAKKSSSEKPSG